MEEQLNNCNFNSSAKDFLFKNYCNEYKEIVDGFTEENKYKAFIEQCETDMKESLVYTIKYYYNNLDENDDEYKYKMNELADEISLYLS